MSQYFSSILVSSGSGVSSLGADLHLLMVGSGSRGGMLLSLIVAFAVGVVWSAARQGGSDAPAWGIMACGAL